MVLKPRFEADRSWLEIYASGDIATDESPGEAYYGADDFIGIALPFMPIVIAYENP